MNTLSGETVVIVETKRKGKPPIQIKTIQTTARLFMDYIHNKLLEAKREGKGMEVRSS